MTCIYCKNKMTKDDEDFNFEGNTNIYWICEKCGASCYEEIRFGKRFKARWHKSEEERNNGSREKF